MIFWRKNDQPRIVYERLDRCRWQTLQFTLLDAALKADLYLLVGLLEFVARDFYLGPISQARQIEVVAKDQPQICFGRDDARIFKFAQIAIKLLLLDENTLLVRD